MEDLSRIKTNADAMAIHKGRTTSTATRYWKAKFDRIAKQHPNLVLEFDNTDEAELFMQDLLHRREFCWGDRIE